MLLQPLQPDIDVQYLISVTLSAEEMVQVGVTHLLG